MALYDINGNKISTGGSYSGAVNAAAVTVEMPSLPAGNLIPAQSAVLTNADQSTGYKFTCYKWEFASSDLGAGKAYRIYAPFAAVSSSSTNAVASGLNRADSPYYEFTVPDNVAFYKYTVICIPAWCDISRCYMLPAESWEAVDFSMIYPQWLNKPIAYRPYNLWNKYVDNVSVGDISPETGAVTKTSATTSYVTKNLIPVQPGKHYTLSMGEEVTGGVTIIALFDGDGTFLYSLRMSSGQYNTIRQACGVFRFCINDENAAYMRCYISANAERYFLVEGDIDADGEIGGFDGDTFENPISAPNQINNVPLTRFKGKTLLALGDSITEANKANGYKSWVAYIAEWVGMNATNGGISGSGLYKYGQSTGSSVYHRLVSRAENDVFAEGTSYDYIILHGFMNDGSSKRDGQLTNGLNVGSPSDEAGTASVYGALKAVFEMLIEYYPTAKIGFVCSTPRWQVSSVTRDDPEGTDSVKCHGHGWFERYIEAYKYLCEEYNIPFLDLYHNSPFRGDQEANVLKYFDVNHEYDTASYGGVVHPGPEGQKEGIAMPIFQWMKTYL